MYEPRVGEKCSESMPYSCNMGIVPLLKLWSPAQEYHQALGRNLRDYLKLKGTGEEAVSSVV